MTKNNIYILLTCALIIASVHCDHEVIHYPNYLNHECNRDCSTSEGPKTCYYDLSLEEMFSMNKECKDCLNGNPSDCFREQCIVNNGDQQIVYAFNRMIPNPPIIVCQYDRVIIRVHNMLMATVMTIHVHGIHLRGQNPMDGAARITQCETLPDTYFTYDFNMEQAGTYFYHGHSPYLLSAGLLGALISRPRNDPQRDLYDYDLNEHVMSMYALPKIDESRNYPRTVYLHEEFSALNISGLSINGFGAQPTNQVPPPRFLVEKGKRYRFRLINANSVDCPVQLTIQGHAMLIIAADGATIDPITVDTLFSTSGERHDFVVNANQAAQSYFMVFESYAKCGGRTSFAILDYASNPTDLNRADVETIQLADDRALGCNEYGHYEECINYNDIYAAETIDGRLLIEQADKQYFFVVNDFDYVNPTYYGIDDEATSTPVINNITYAKVGSTLLLQDPNDHPPYCNYDDRSVCDPNEPVCHCTHVIETPFDKTIELIFLNVPNVDGETEGHPMHIHGYNFAVMGLGQVDAYTMDDLKRADRDGKLQRNFRNAVMKDSLIFPGGNSYMVLRLISDNPGFWLFHCHLGIHFMQGFLFVLKTGNYPMEDIPKDFPRCDDF